MEYKKALHTTPFDIKSLPPEALKYVAQLQEENKSLTQQVNSLQWNLKEFYRQVYGKKSEKFITSNPYQLSLFDTSPSTPDSSQDQDRPVEIKYKRKRRKKKALPLFKGRFPEWLPREDAGTIEIPAETLPCPDCHTERVPFTYKTVERLAHRVERSLVVKEYKIPVCRCPQCTDSIVSPPAPATPLENIQVESSFYAHILSEKFEYGLPFYRVEKRLQAQKLPITRTTLCEYQVRIADLLKPLADCLWERMRESEFLHIDETKWQVARNINGKSVFCHAWGWMFLSAQGDVAMNYGVARTKRFLSDLMPHYKGAIVCDGEDHYDYYRNVHKCPLARCNVHARRRFEKALKSHPAQAQFALRLYALLYRREEFILAKEREEQEVLRLRKRQMWLLEKLREFCDTHQPSTFPKSPLGKAIRYFLAYYDELTYFSKQQSIPIDNNPCERMIRKFVIGRKAWLFAASEEGARSAATIYSLVLTCMHNDIPVVEYLDDVIHRVGVLKSTDYLSMLPQVWWKIKNHS